MAWARWDRESSETEEMAMTHATFRRSALAGLAFLAAAGAPARVHA